MPFRFPAVGLVLVAALLTVGLTLSQISSHGPRGGNVRVTTATAQAATNSSQAGYDEVASDGGLFTFGAAQFHGSMGGRHLDAPIVGMAADTTTGGYYLVASDGGVFAFTAPYHGSMGARHLDSPIVGIAFDPSTGGYWEVASDGGIFAFTAPFHGSMGGRHLDSPIVGMAADTTTGGYYLVASDGGIFAFAAPYHGSMGGRHLDSPIVGIAFDPSTGGYYLVASDGGIFTFTAPYHGSMGGRHLDSPIVGMAGTSDGNGYWLVAADGGIFAFGDAGFEGSEGGKRLNSPIVGMTAVSSGAPHAASGNAVCGSSSLRGPASPPARAIVLPAGSNATVALAPNQTYWLASGVHTLGTGEYDQFDPASGDSFIGAPGAVVNGQNKNQSAFDDNSSAVKVEYLTVENFVGNEGQMVVNHTGAPDWIVEHDTIEHNGGAGVGLGTGSVVEDNCLTANQEYGFSSFAGSTGVTLSGNEISYNDATGTYDHGGSSITCGCSGGGKFWHTVDTTVTNNYVHNNGNVGIWVDTDNAGFDISDNVIEDNYSEGIIYETSYNALISNNTFVGNALGSGPTLSFPDSAIYISESGGDSRVHSNYAGELDITGNVFTNNWGGVVLWENSNRACGETTPTTCTLVTPKVYTHASCAAHLQNSSPTQTPDYYDNCRWKTQNVVVSDNTFSFNPSAVGSACESDSTTCGLNGLFSEDGTTAPWKGFTVPLHISDGQGNLFTDNTYSGPWKFDGFTLGQVVTWSQWRNGFSDTSGSNDHFNGQDAGSTYDPKPPPA